MLAFLRGHFRRMLEMQREVYDDTGHLDRLAEEQRNRHRGSAAEPVSNKQRDIVAEVEKLILIVRQDGSSVGLLEALGQVREDMQQVADRLAQGKAGKITQRIELDIIEALEELRDALSPRTRALNSTRQHRLAAEPLRGRLGHGAGRRDVVELKPVRL
jgi:hypothetical protein